MPIDANIVLGIKPAEIPNQLDQAVKAMSLVNLSSEAKIHQLGLIQKQREIADDTSLRASALNNTRTLSDGTPVLDRAGYLSSLAKGSNPMLAQTEGLRLNKQDVELEAQRLQKLKQVGFQISDEDSYQKALPELAKYGADVKNYPPTYGDGSFVNEKLMHLLTAEEQVQQKNKEIDHAIAKTGQEIQLAKIKQDQEHFNRAHEQEANQSYAKTIEGMGQRPDVKTALSDSYQVQKARAVLAPWEGHLQDAPLSAMRLFETEKSKLAKGGVAGEGETEAGIPDTYKQKYAQYKQDLLKGRPVAADAKEFLQLGLNYVNDLDKIAVSKIQSANNEALEQHAQYMSPRSVEMAKKLGTQRFIEAEHKKMADQESAQKSGEMHSAVIAHAKEILANKNSSAEEKDKAQRALGIAEKMVGQK